MIIYKITNKLNSKIYIGQTQQKLSHRWNQHNRGNSGCRALSSAIALYGKDQFTIEQLAVANSIDELNELEDYYIKLYNSLAPNGYNLTTGVKNRIITDEYRERMRISSTGKKHTEESKLKIGKASRERKYSDEFKLKMSELKKGKNNPYYGKKLSEEHKKKISESMKKARNKV